MEETLKDIRYALRTLAARPGFSLVAVLTLALGIGANATVYTWVEAVLLRPMPGVAEPDRVVQFVPSSAEERRISISYPVYRDFRDRATTLEGLIAYDTQAMSFGAGPSPERVWGMIVSGNYFDVLGVRMEKGRGFLPEEDATKDTHHVAVVSHDFWRARLGGAGDAVGRTIVLNNTPFEVVGVAPEEFRGNLLGLSFDVWVPMMTQPTVAAGADRLERRGDRWLETMARLKPGVTIEQAASEMSSIAARLAEENPVYDRSLSVELFPLWKSPKGAGQIMVPLVLVLFVVAALVLAIACANVASLMLARASERRREIAIRMSLGAGRWRIARQLLTESLVLSALGGAAGVVVAMWGSGLIMLFVPATDLPVGLHTNVGGSAVAVAAAVAVLTGLAFGLAPALDASRSGVVEGIKDGAATHTGGRAMARLRSGLVVAQIAISLLLLVAAGLLLRSLDRATRVDPGFDTSNVALATVDLFAGGYDEERGRAAIRAMLDRAASLPGVESATVGRKVPLAMGGTSSRGLEVEGFVPDGEARPHALYNLVGPDYFETLRIPLLRGRGLERGDGESAPKVVVVNEAMAERYWPGADAIGGRIRWGGEWATVVGVVANAKFRRLDERPEPFFYVPVLQDYGPETVLHVRTSGDAAAAAASLRAVVGEAAPGALLYDVSTLEERVAAATFQQRAASALLGAFGGLALLLASVGVYGVLAYTVARRTREFGIRIALGADRARLLALVLGEAGRLVAAGVAVGLIGAAAVTRMLSSLLFGVSATDPVAYAAATLFLALVALAACLVPARRAASVDPVDALKSE